MEEKQQKPGQEVVEIIWNSIILFCYPLKTDTGFCCFFIFSSNRIEWYYLFRMKMRSWNGFPRGVALVVTLLCFHHGIHAQNAANDRTVVKSTVPAVVLPSSADVATNTIDPALQVMTYNVGDGVKETMVYMEPSLEQMYAHTEPKPSTPLQRVTPKFKGFAGKFINMSNKPVTLYWYVLLLLGFIIMARCRFDVYQTITNFDSIPLFSHVFGSSFSVSWVLSLAL